MEPDFKEPPRRFEVITKDNRFEHSLRVLLESWFPERFSIGAFRIGGVAHMLAHPERYR